MASSRRIVIGPQVVRFVDAINGGTWDDYAVGIGLEKDGELVAGVKFDAWNGVSICMHVAAVGRYWMSREYLRYCFHYPFNEVGAAKILGFVDCSNTHARRFDEHLGFVLEATIESACAGGDLCIYSMTKEQCRYLENGPRKLRHTLNKGSPPQPARA